MKLLYMSCFDIAGSNGPGVNEYETVRELLRRLGEDVRFVIPKPSRHLPELGPYETQFYYLYSENGGTAATRVLFRKKAMIRAFSAACEDFKPELLLFRPVFCPSGQIRCAELSGVPYVIKTLGKGVMNPFGKRKGLKSAAAPLLLKHNKRLMRRLLGGASAIDVSTTEYVTMFSAMFPEIKDKLHLIENATNTNMFRPMDQAEARERTTLTGFTPIIGYTGGSPYTRGGRQMIESAPLLEKAFPNIGIVIVGPADDRLKKAAAESPCKNHIVLPGKVPYEQVPYYTNSFDVCVSFDTITNIASGGNSSQKVRQYLACGKPVLSSGGINTAFLTENRIGTVINNSDSIEAFAEGAIGLLSLSEVEKRAVCDRATAYATEKMSVRKAFDDRFAIWETCLK